MKRYQIGLERTFQMDFELYNTLTTWKNNRVYLPKLSKRVPIQYLVREEDPIRRGGSPPILGNWSTNKVAKATRDQTRLGWRQTDEVYRCLDKELKKSCRTEKMLIWGLLRLQRHRQQQTIMIRRHYRIVSELTGARSNSNVPIKSKDGKVLLTNDD